MFVKLENNVPVKWPVPEYELRQSVPNSSLPEVISDSIASELGYAPFVFCGYPAEYDSEWQDIEEVVPILKEDGNYHQSYEITDKYAPEEKQQIISDESKADNKGKAEQLLRDSDWTQMPDVDLVNKEAFTAYRAGLRVIALNPPVTVDNWPVKPEELWSV